MICHSALLVHDNAFRKKLLEKQKPQLFLKMIYLSLWMIGIKDIILRLIKM